MGERDDAQRAIEDARERMSDVIGELSRRASGEYVSQRAKEAAVRKTTEFKDRARESPAAFGLLGGALGATIGSLLGRQAQRRVSAAHRRELLYPTPERYESTAGYADTGYYEGVGVESQRDVTGAARARASEVSGRVQEKASEYKERLSEKSEQARIKASETIEHARGTAAHMRERIPSGGEIKERAGSWYGHMINDQPLLLGLGVIGIGLAAALLLPESEPERRTMRPMKERAFEKIDEAQARAEEAIAGEEEAPSAQLSTPVVEEPSTSIH